jgi:hypothetical protein
VAERLLAATVAATGTATRFRTAPFIVVVVTPTAVSIVISIGDRRYGRCFTRGNGRTWLLSPSGTDFFLFLAQLSQKIR